MQNNEDLPTEDPDDGSAHEAQPTSSSDRPLGYWLRVVDAFITREFAHTLETEGVGRREWMALNVLAGTIDAPGLAERLARRGKLVRRLEERGWAVASDDGHWTLTDEGRAAHERLAGLVDGVRAKVADAVSPEQYAQLTSSLEAIARGLGWDEQAAWPARGFGRRHGFDRDRGFGPRFGGFGPGHGFDRRHGDEEHDGPRRPSPVDGPNWHRGFGPGGDPRHPHGHGNGHGYRYVRGHDPEGLGHGPHGCDPHGEHPHDRGHGRARHAAEHGYERGFTAGFEAGRRQQSDPAA